ncbi:response regulator receiver protein [Chloroherpeton thalassium ATCC 35110]|uniref:Response regulator receiver protein n=1 Tax=Chloroherpeton thalassium (strain ATCC 35110 / GB-78) TaxID=517418 RepID=B3QW83_CHLT3|nr:response regulator [Chloroherpeton thalassium]ACF13196.1 response regulator receiver protein [Chloroherpeton thalassium ATCC 35110]
MPADSNSEINILLVDDEPMVLQSLSATFRKQYNVYTATNGKEAIELIRQHQIHVVLSDQRMPGMLGHEVLRIIKTISPSTIRILLTGYSDLDAIMNSVNSGEVFRYLTKPWKVEQLRETVAAAAQIASKVSQLYPKTAADAEDVATATEADVATEPEVKEPTRQQQASAEIGQKNKLLIVEFNREQLNMMVKVFERKYTVLPAATVDEAFEHLSKQEIPVMVTDLNLNSEDGIEFLYAIKQEYPNIVIILLTQVRDALLAIKSINEFQVYRYHVKPCSVEDLDKTIQSAMMRARSYRSQPMQNVHYVAKQVAPDVIEKQASEKGNWLRERLRTVKKFFGV